MSAIIHQRQIWEIFSTNELRKDELVIENKEREHFSGNLRTLTKVFYFTRVLEIYKNFLMKFYDKWLNFYFEKSKMLVKIKDIFLPAPLGITYREIAIVFSSVNRWLRNSTVKNLISEECFPVEYPERWILL